MQSSPGPSRQPIESHGVRWFYVWCLPTLWVLPVATVWSMSIFEGGSHYGIVMALTVWPVLRLANRLGGPYSNNLDQAVVACTLGCLAVGLMGILQDLLRVPSPKRIVAFSLIAMLAAFLLVPYVLWPFGVPQCLEGVLAALIFGLVIFCNLVLVFGVGSIAVYTLIAVGHLFSRFVIKGYRRR